MTSHRESARAWLSGVQLADGLVQESFSPVSLILAGVCGRLSLAGTAHRSTSTQALQHGRLGVVGVVSWQLRVRRVAIQQAREKLRGLFAALPLVSQAPFPSCSIEGSSHGPAQTQGEGI